MHKSGLELGNENICSVFRNSKRKFIKRWANKLDPELSKQKWTDVDGKRLLELHKIWGSTWKAIASEFPGRTDNFLKNQYFSLIRRALRRICKFLDVSKSNFVTFPKKDLC